jgi:hypothetical protein
MGIQIVYRSDDLWVTVTMQLLGVTGRTLMTILMILVVVVVFDILLPMI